MRYEYEFDFGPNPSFIIDGWFMKIIGKIFLLCVVLFALCAFSPYMLARVVIPAIAIGALIIFFGVFLFRRNVARRRIANVENTVFRYAIDEEGIHYDNEIGAGLIKWGFKGKLLPLKTFIMLQSNEIGLLPVPLEAPPDVLAMVREKLAKR